MVVTVIAVTAINAEAKDVASSKISESTTQIDAKKLTSAFDYPIYLPKQATRPNYTIIAQSMPGANQSLLNSNLEEVYGPEFFGVDTSCALRIAIGCKKGFYFSTSYVGTNSNILPISSGSYETIETTLLYRSGTRADDAFYGLEALISIRSDLEISDNTEHNFGGNILLGYDYGGFRTDIMGSVSSFTKTLGVNGGSNFYTLNKPFNGGGVNYSAGSYHEIGGALPEDISFDIDTYTLMARGFIDVPTGLPITPFFGFGLGAKAVYVGSDSSEGYDICTHSSPSLYNPCPSKFEVEGGTTLVFTGQVIAGLSLQLTKKASLNSELIYDYTSGGTAGEYDFADSGNFTGSFGIRYKF